MKKLLVPILGLVLGLVGGTAWTVVTAEAPPEVPADSTLVADSAAADSTLVADSGSVGADDHVSAEPGGDPASSEAHESGHADPVVLAADAPASVDEESGAGTGASDPAGRPAATATEQLDAGEQAQKLARIFSSMQPRDAARVLEQLSDGEITSILRRMGARQAASVLSAMNPDHAARLTRVVLGAEATR